MKMTDCSCGATFYEPQHHSSACSYRKYGWVSDYSDDLLALLDRIEIKDDASLAAQRFEIAEKYGMTVEMGERVSGYDN